MIPVSLAVLLGMSAYIVPKEIRRQRNKMWIFFNFFFKLFFLVFRQVNSMKS